MQCRSASVRLLVLALCTASLTCWVDGSRGMCMYSTIDRRGGQWRIPERCTHLYLTQINFGPVGAKQMGQALSSNPTVTRVDSSSCNIKGRSGAAALGESLTTNTVLQRWDLGNNALGDTGAAALADGLAVNTALRSLNLAHNRIGPVGAAALAEALRRNTALTWLNLDSNRIHDDGVERLADMLRVNEVLETLILSGNQINNEGIALLAEALPHNRGLRTLHVKYNRISAEGVRRLAEAVVANGRVTVAGPMPLLHSIARHQLKRDAWDHKNATLMLDVARMYEAGTMGTQKLKDRNIQAYLWYSLVAKHADAATAGAAQAKAQAMTVRTGFSAARCPPSCVDSARDLMATPLGEEPGRLFTPGIRKKRWLRRQVGGAHHAKDEL